MKKKSMINVTEFEKMERKVASMNDLKGAMSQILWHSAMPEKKSENLRGKR